MEKKTKISYHKGDLPPHVSLGKVVAVDTETMGLNILRDRLCVVQLSFGNGEAHVIQLDRSYKAPRLIKLLADPKVLKIFHFARFDLAALEHYLGVRAAPVFCTKIASRLARTSAPHHGLKFLCKDLLGIELSKQQQTSDWGARTLSDEQLTYAACDVLYLHQLKDLLTDLLKREGRFDLAQACFDFLPFRAALDLAGWAEEDLFAHS